MNIWKCLKSRKEYVTDRRIPCAAAFNTCHYKSIHHRRQSIINTLPRTNDKYLSIIYSSCLKQWPNQTTGEKWQRVLQKVAEPNFLIQRVAEPYFAAKSSRMNGSRRYAKRDRWVAEPDQQVWEIQRLDKEKNKKKMEGRVRIVHSFLEFLAEFLRFSAFGEFLGSTSWDLYRPLATFGRPFCFFVCSVWLTL